MPSIGKIITKEVAQPKRSVSEKIQLQINVVVKRLRNEMGSEHQINDAMAVAAYSEIAGVAPQLPGWLIPRPIQARRPGTITNNMTYAQRLFHYTYGKTQREIPFLEYSTLQRLNIFALQNRLARLKTSFSEKQEASESELEALKNALHDYTNAIRDYAYFATLDVKENSAASDRYRRGLEQAFPEIAKLKGEAFGSRFCHLPVTAEIASDPIRDFLRNFLPRRLTWTKSEKSRNRDEWIDHRPPNTISPSVDKLARFIVAFAGGASLVVPMLVMTLPSTNKIKSLVTVSVAVTLFAMTMSIGIRTSNADTLVATATYAAVLIVFVGTSQSTENAPTAGNF